jgi:hypothetical protein
MSRVAGTDLVRLTHQTTSVVMALRRVAQGYGDVALMADCQRDLQTLEQQVTALIAEVQWRIIRREVRDRDLKAPKVRRPLPLSTDVTHGVQIERAPFSAKYSGAP